MCSHHPSISSSLIISIPTTPPINVPSMMAGVSHLLLPPHPAFVCLLVPWSTLYLHPQSCLPPRPYCCISCHPRRAASHIKSILLALTCILRLNLHITQEILLYPSTNHLLSLAQGCPLCLFYGMLLINIVDTSYHSDKRTQALAKMQNGRAEHLPLSILSSMRLLCLRYKH